MRRLAAMTAALLASACTTVGPDYTPPTPPPASASWIAPVGTGAVDPAWWQGFGDPALTALVERALAQASSVRKPRHGWPKRGRTVRR